MSAAAGMSELTLLSEQLEDVRRSLDEHHAETDRILAERQQREQELRADIAAFERVISKLRNKMATAATATPVMTPAVSGVTEPEDDGIDFDGFPETADYLEEPETPSPLIEGTIGYYAAKVLQEAGGSLDTSEIAHRVRRLTNKWNDIPKSKFGASVYSAMHRRKDYFVLIERGHWDLVRRGEQA